MSELPKFKEITLVVNSVHNGFVVTLPGKTQYVHGPHGPIENGYEVNKFVFPTWIHAAGFIGHFLNQVHERETTAWA